MSVHPTASGPVGGGRLSSGFSQPIGTNVVPGSVRGYHLDMRVKATAAQWPPPDLQPLERQLHVDVAQWGLGAYEHFLETGDEQWLAVATAAAGHFARTQTRDGALAGGWVHDFPYPHTFALRAGWLSSMAQGEAASLLVRVFAETGDEQLAEAARLALGPLTVSSAQGGVLTELAGGAFYEEYPTQPSSYVLNGAIFTLWGCYDVATALGDERAGRLFREGADTLAAEVGRWDLGWWSRYDLFPHPLPNVASPGYHELHIDQLTALHRIEPRPSFVATADRFRGYARSRVNAKRALVAKVGFRLAVPRNAALARRLPWTKRA